jgi:hypothetical protein
MLRRQAIGHEVQAAAGEEQRIDVIRIQNVFQGQGPLPGRAEPVQLSLVKDDVLLRSARVSRDSGAGVDLAVDGAVFFVADVLTTAGVQPMAADVLAGQAGGIGFDGHSDQAELEQAGPRAAAALAGSCAQGRGQLGSGDVGH